MIGARIKSRRKQLRITQKELGEIVGKGESTISEWESAKRSPDIELLPRLADKLDTTIAYLMGWTEDPHGAFDNSPQDAVKIGMSDDACLTLPPGALPITRQRIPLLGSIHAGEPTFSDASFDCYVEAGAAIRCDFALRVVGDSMINARILDGDIVFIRKQDTVENGEIAAVLLDDETTLKRVRFLPGGMTLFAPENPAYQPIVVGGEGETRNARILGKAVGFQSNIR